MDRHQIAEYLDKLKGSKKSVSQIRNKAGQINAKDIRKKIKELGESWFSDIRQFLTERGFLEDVLRKYDDAFKHLILISSNRGNQKNSYLKDLNVIVKDFNREILLKMSTTSSSGIMQPEIMSLYKILGDIDDGDSNNYLKEAIDCANKNFLRASIVLGWCACIDSIHKKIEQIGIDKFCITSSRIASVKQGRFKRYNSVFNISTINELREVFDDKILWIIEGMGLVDLNEHTRLSGCFSLRNQCAHPGDAPITIYNLLSFFSDIKEIIIKNDKFRIL